LPLIVKFPTPVVPPGSIIPPGALMTFPLMAGKKGDSVLLSTVNIVPTQAHIPRRKTASLTGQPPACAGGRVAAGSPPGPADGRHPPSTSPRQRVGRGSGTRATGPPRLPSAVD